MAEINPDIKKLLEKIQEEVLKPNGNREENYKNTFGIIDTSEEGLIRNIINGVNGEMTTHILTKKRDFKVTLIKQISDIEYANNIEIADMKEDWDYCFNGRWYQGEQGQCDKSEIGVILEKAKSGELELVEEIFPWNSKHTHFDYIVGYENDEGEKELFAIKIAGQDNLGDGK